MPDSQMTLREYVERLPSYHIAHKEFDALEADNAALEQRVENYDALLAVVRMAIAYEQTLAPFGSADEGFYHVGDEIALDNFQDAITALPEHLKEEA